METSASFELSNLILFIPGAIILFLLIFFLIAGVIIRSVFKSISRQIPIKTIKELHALGKQFPQGISWEQLKKDWDMKIDRETGKFIIKKKTAAGREGDSTLKPTEIQVTELAQLPAALRQLVSKVNQEEKGNAGIKFTPSPTPTSASSTISTPKATSQKQGYSPRSYEIIQTIKRIAIVIFLLGLFYGLGSIFG